MASPSEFLAVLNESLESYGIQDYTLETIRPTDRSPVTLAEIREALAANEASDRDLILTYFNQGVLTGDWDGPPSRRSGPTTQSPVRC